MAARPLRSLLPVVLPLVVVAGTVAAPTAADTPAAGPDPVATENVFVLSINLERAQAGLAPLAPDAGLRSQARDWSSHLASTGVLAHDPTLRADTFAVDPGWQLTGENVGEGAYPPAIERAFMASPPHRENVLGDYTRVGVGVVVDPHGTVWVTERFLR